MRKNSPNEYHGTGANGGCFFEVVHVREGRCQLDVGHSCVVVHRGEIPVTWLSEIIAIATAHKGGIAGFLKANEAEFASESYALMCDPALTEAQGDV